MTWNYDMQFEKAMLQYSGFSDQNLEKLFNIEKLNGSLMKGNFFDLNKKYYDPKAKRDLIFEEIFKNYHSFDFTNSIPNFDSNLQFSWERSNFDFSNILFLPFTEILVVIGYSFPFFNRNIDQVIFGSQNMPRLRKVYIQVSEKDTESVAMRFRSIRPNFTHDKMNFNQQPIEFITSVDQFFLPPEL